MFINQAFDLQSSHVQQTSFIDLLRFFFFFSSSVPSGTALFSCWGVEEWNRRWRRHWNSKEWAVFRLSTAWWVFIEISYDFLQEPWIFFYRWKVFVRSVYVQDLSLGIKSASDDPLVGAQRLLGGARRGLERLSILSHGHHGKNLTFLYLILFQRQRWYSSTMQFVDRA